MGQHQSQQDWALQILVASLYERKWKDDKNVGFYLSLQGSRAESLPLFSLPAWLSTTFDIVGISLALIDFTGIARHIEAGFAKYRDWERDHAKDTLERRNRHLSPEGMRSFWSLRSTGVRLWDDLFIFGLGALALWLMDGFARLNEILPDWPNWVWWSLLLISPLIWVGLYMVSISFGMLLGYWRATIVWRFFWLLSRPKAGVLGTIGFALTFVDSGLNLLSQYLGA